MTDYKILQNIDIAQNEIKEISKISNDRSDKGGTKHLIIQTGEDTSLTLSSEDNSIESVVKKEASTSDKIDMVSNIKSTPQEISIVHKRTDKSDETEKVEESKISLHSNAYTDESDKRGHILVQSSLVDIQTGEGEEDSYDDSSIKLSKKKGSTLGSISLKSNTIALSGGTDSLKSDISIEDKFINASSKKVELSSKDTTSAVLTLEQDTQTISSTARKEIKETVDKVSISLKNDTLSQSITLSNVVESSPSKIEITDSNVKINKGDTSFTTSSTEVTVENTTFSINKVVENEINPILEVSAPKTGESTTKILGTKATINPTTVEIGTDNTSAITIGSTSTSITDTTTLQSNTTEVNSSTINIGTDSTNPTENNISIGHSNSNVTITGKNNLSLLANDTDSSIKSNNIEFTNSLYSNNIKIYWDATLQSLVFARG